MFDPEKFLNQNIFLELISFRNPQNTYIWNQSSCCKRNFKGTERKLGKNLGEKKCTRKISRIGETDGKLGAAKIIYCVSFGQNMALSIKIAEKIVFSRIYLIRTMSIIFNFGCLAATAYYFVYDMYFVAGSYFNCYLPETYWQVKVTSWENGYQSDISGMSTNHMKQMRLIYGKQQGLVKNQCWSFSLTPLLA